MSLLSNLWYELVPFPRLLAFNRNVRSGLETPNPREIKWATLGREKLLSLLADEWDRAKQLDEKLFKVTTALSLAVAAVGVASKAVLDALPSGPMKILLLVVLLYAIASLFAGTVMGFSGLRPKPRAGYGPDFALRIRHDNARAVQQLADALTHFEITNILRSNEAMAANTAIRNGVIAFALAMTFSLFIPAQKPAAPALITQPISITVNAAPVPPPQSAGQVNDLNASSVGDALDPTRHRRSPSPSELKTPTADESTAGNPKAGPNLTPVGSQ